MSYETGLLPKFSPDGTIILAKYQFGHSYTFWTKPILIFSPVQIIMRHPLSTPTQLHFESRHIILNPNYRQIFTKTYLKLPQYFSISPTVITFRLRNIANTTVYWLNNQAKRTQVHTKYLKAKHQTCIIFFSL